MKTRLICVLKYFYALFSCVYLFFIGFFVPKHRRLINYICIHFGLYKLPIKTALEPGAITDLKKPLEEQLENGQFARYVMYIDIANFVKKYFNKDNFNNPKIIEFGGSNGIIGNMFDYPSYEIARNYPFVDLHNLSRFSSDCYDFVIVDQVLEHVSDPWKCVEEMYRILKKGGWLITTVPFLVIVHDCPGDYWRFSKQGMEELLSGFSETIVKSWGNKKIVINHIESGGFPSTKQCREDGIFDLENEEECPHVIWSYSKK